MNVKVYGILESAIASGYPMRTEVKDDMDFTLMAWDMYENAVDEEDKGVLQGAYEGVEASIKRLTKLGNTNVGTGHSNALKGVTVQADLTCSQAMHMQILRYNFFDIVSSQSKMHRLLEMDVSKSVNEYVDKITVNHLQDLIDLYNEDNTKENYLKVIYNCPIGLELTFRFTTNYLQLKTIYNQRHNHQLPEWRLFADWMLTLPKFEELTGCNKEG
jgi:hypothetical protein